MPFDALPARLGSIPDVSSAAVQTMNNTPRPVVHPIGDIIEHGVKQVEGIIEKFSPLSRAERAAKISQSTLQAQAYQMMASADPKVRQEGMARLAAMHGKYQTENDSLKKQLLWAQIGHTNALTKNVGKSGANAKEQIPDPLNAYRQAAGGQPSYYGSQQQQQVASDAVPVVTDSSGIPKVSLGDDDDVSLLNDNP